MTAFAEGMGGGAQEEFRQGLTIDEIQELLAQQQCFNVTGVANASGLTGFIFDQLVPADSPLVLTAMNSPEMVSVILDIAPPPGVAIFNCTTFFIGIEIAGEEAGKRIVSLDAGKMGQTPLPTEIAIKFQQVLESAAKAADTP